MDKTFESKKGTTHVQITAPDLVSDVKKIGQNVDPKNLPSNAEIEKAFERSKDVLEQEKKDAKLDSQGKLLLDDAEKIIDTAERAFLDKNKDEKLQKLFRDIQAAIQENSQFVKKESSKLNKETKGDQKKLEKKAKDIKKEATKEGQKMKEEAYKIQSKALSKAEELKPDAEQVQKDSRELYESLKNFFYNFLKSEDFRGLLADWIKFFHYMSTQKLKEQAQKNETQGGVTSNIAKAVDEGIETPSKSADKEELKDRSQYMFNMLLERVRTNPEYQKAANDLMQLIDRLQVKLGELKEEVQPGIEKLAKDVQSKTESMAQSVTKDVKDVAKDVQKKTEKSADNAPTDRFWDILYDAREVLSEFTGRQELNDFQSTLYQIYVAVKTDKDIREWMFDMKNYMDSITKDDRIKQLAIDTKETTKKVDKESTEELKLKGEELKERGQDIAEEKKQEANVLLEKGRAVWQKEKWSNLWSQLNDQFQALLYNMKTDKYATLLNEQLKQLGRDMVTNQKGQLDLYVLEDSMIQMKNLLVDLVKKQLEQISIAQIEFYNETYDIKIKDFGFSGSFLPEHIDFVLRNDTHMDTKDSSKDIMRQLLAFRVDHIKPEFKHFKFYMKRKTFPKIEDYGAADMKIGGAGASIYITWKIESRGGSKPIATLTDVKCHIDKLDLHIIGEETKHNILDSMMAPFVAGGIKNKIAHTLEELLRNKLGELNTRINQFFDSQPLETLKDKTNETLEQGFKKFSQIASSVNAV